MNNARRRAHGSRSLIAALVVLAVTAPWSLAVTGPAVAATLDPPGDLAPTGAVSTSTPTFTWSRPAKATGYRIEIDDDPAFGSPFVAASTPNAAYVHTARLRAGSWYWRVRATAGSDQSPWASDVVVVDGAAPPVQVSPIDGQQLSQPEEPALLQWTPVPGAVGYEVQVDATEDDQPDWIGATSWTTAGSSFQVPTPQEPRTWAWRVRADLGSGNVSSWSSGAKYTVLPLAPVEPDPSMTTDSVQDVVLKWLPVEGATRYELQVGLDRDFNNVLETRTVVGTRYSPPTTYDNDQYFWRVRAIDSGGNKMSWPSVPFVLHRDWPQRPDLLWPPDSNLPVGDDFYYQWTPVPHASEYEVSVSSDPNFTTSTTCRTASTTLVPRTATVSACAAPQGGTRYWRVRAIDGPGNVEGIYSAVGRFTYDSGVVAQLAPAHGATVAVPTLEWQAARDAVAYDVAVRAADNDLVATIRTNSLSWTPSGANGLAASEGPFTWTVQAVDQGGGVSPLPAGRTFSVAGAPPTTGAPALTPRPVAPSVRFPALSWEPVPEAKHYRLRLGVSGSGFWDAEGSAPISQLSWPYPAATDTGERYLIPGEYAWQVKAVLADGTSTAWGPVGSFEITDLPPVQGQRIALDGRALDDGDACTLALGQTVTEDRICRGLPATPVFDWESVPGAGYYRFYLSNDRELTNRVISGDGTNTSRWTPDWTTSPKALADNQAGESYYWYVRPCKTVNVCGPDPVSTNRAATNAFRKVSPAVEVVNPREALPGHQDRTATECTPSAQASRPFEVSFHWEDYYCTNQDVHVDPYGGDEPSHQTARSYRVEVATSASFASPLQTAEVDQTTWTPVQQTLPEGQLWWRVQAVDAQGNKLTWSAPQMVEKESSEPELTTPDLDAVVPGDTPFRWAAQQHAASYRLEVYRNDDTTYSPANLVFAVDTKLASYVWTKLLPPAGAPYRWRVRWVDASGRPGPWSKKDDGRFAVARHEVSLGSPADQAYVNPQGLVLSWDPVDRAARYQLQVRSVAGGSVFNVTTVATSWAADSSLVDGHYEWRVTALDASNGELAQSGWRPFAVDTARPAVKSWTPKKRAAPDATFQVKLTEPVTGMHSRSMKLYVVGRTTPLPAAVTLAPNGRTATLDPSKKLVAGKKYRVRLLTAVRDLAGNKLQPFAWEVRVEK